MNNDDFETWKKDLNLKYTFGATRSDGASRRYNDSKLGIGAECHTPRDVNTRKWGNSEWLYYLETSTKEHETLEGLFKEVVELNG